MAKRTTAEVLLENDWVILKALAGLLLAGVPDNALKGAGVLDQIADRMRATTEALAVCSPERAE